MRSQFVVSVIFVEVDNVAVLRSDDVGYKVGQEALTSPASDCPDGAIIVSPSKCSSRRSRSAQQGCGIGKSRRQKVHQRCPLVLDDGATSTQQISAKCKGDNMFLNQCAQPISGYTAKAR